MRKITQKIPAKINLTLDVCEKEANYHLIRSLVVSVDLFDTVTVIKRKDDIVTLREKGISAECNVIDNNAFKAAKLFMRTFHVGGVDIILNKSIPVSNGLGGSSADVAAVLLAMNKLFGVDGAMRPLADSLGSDATYMLTGGYAILKGRGEIVEQIDADKPLYMILITEKEGIKARECYNAYDDNPTHFTDSTGKAINCLTSEDGNFPEDLCQTLKNDLYESALKFRPQMKTNIENLISSGAINASMTGSGSTVFGIYADKKAQKNALKTLLEIYPKERVIPVKTVVK